MALPLKFDTKAMEHLQYWIATDIKTVKKIFELLHQIERTPCEGKGKPEALKGNLTGYWSRRINEFDRIIYEPTESEIKIISCKGHYS